MKIAFASATPSGLVVTTARYGPYSDLHLAHDAIHRRRRRSGYQLAAPNWEVYDHWKDEYNSDPSKIRTNVFHFLVAGRT